MWINQIIINNFRNYKGEVSFQLDKKITIIYGDNGFGKSSFFDAIEWGLTGIISRFEQNDLDDGFDSIELINEDALKQDEATCSVILYFGNYILKRHFSTNNGKTNNTYVELKKIYTEDDGSAQTINGKVNVSNKLRAIFMPNLTDNTLDIKAPFILSQDQVTDFVVKNKPKQRYKALANLVGLNKIINYSDNMRLVIRELNSKLKELDDTIIKTQAVIDTYSSHKNVYLEEIISEAEKIPITLPPYIEEYQGVIDDARFKLNSEIIKTKKQHQLLEKYTEKDSLTFEMIISSKNSLNLTTNRIENHIAVVKVFIDKVNNKLRQLEKDELNIKKANEFLQQQDELNKRIVNKHNKIKELKLSPYVDINTIDAEIEKLSRSIESLNFNLSYYDAFHKVVAENNEISLEVNATNSLLANLASRKKRKEEWISKLSKWLQSNSLDNEKNKLQELLKGINEYLILTREYSICPVCSSDNEGKLLDISKSNLLSMTEALQKQTSTVKRVLVMKSKVESSVGIIKNCIKSEENKIENSNRIITKNNDQFSRIINSQYFNGSNMETSKLVLLASVEKFNKDFESLNNLKTYFIQLKELERQEFTLKKSINDVNQLIISNNPDVLSMYYNIALKRETYLNSIKLILSSKKAEYDTINLEINMLTEHGVSIDEVPFLTRYQQLENVLGVLQTKIERIDKVNTQYSEFKSSETIMNLLQDARNKQHAAKERLEYINTKIVLINTYIDELNKKVGSEAINFLNQENSSVQQLYRYLNPMVSSKRLKFVAGEEELSIKVTNEGENAICKESSANYVLSSGQMNVLALSIFLSINDAMESELNFVAIDDPIQNMDDVNQFSVCDILSTLRRQLIFSTHDLDFIKLFVKKNEHLNGVIQVYMLKQPVISSKGSYEQIIFGQELPEEQNVILLNGALANVGSSISTNELLDFFKRETSSAEYYKLVPKQGSLVAAAFDWKAVLSNTSSINQMAQVIWAAYERFIMPLKQSGNDDAFLFIAIKNQGHDFSQFAIGTEYKEKELFVRDFVDTAQKIIKSLTKEDLENEIVEIINSDLWKKI